MNKNLLLKTIDPDAPHLSVYMPDGTIVCSTFPELVSCIVDVAGYTRAANRFDVNPQTIRNWVEGSSAHSLLVRYRQARRILEAIGVKTEILHLNETKKKEE